MLSMFYSNETNVSVPSTFASPWYAIVQQQYGYFSLILSMATPDLDAHESYDASGENDRARLLARGKLI